MFEEIKNHSIIYLYEIFRRKFMFTTKRIGPKSKDLGKIKKLYEEAFPEKERFSFSSFHKACKFNKISI